MKKEIIFDRCIYCFGKKESDTGACPHCGYSNEFGGLPAWWMFPGTVLRGRYIVGRSLKETEDRLSYLGWDLDKQYLVEITEYFPKKYVTRDITASESVSCKPGFEMQFDEGCQQFFEKAKSYFKCIIRVEESKMDFFKRNNTCYYVRERSAKLDKFKEKQDLS
mgnify:CR=1 FL=1